MLKTYEDEVALKYRVYNSIFLMLKLERIRNTGILLPVFNEACVAGFEMHQHPSSIMDDFISNHKDLKSPGETADLLFRFIQYVERQIVLIDAIEEAEFEELTDIRGEGSLAHWLSAANEAQYSCLEDFKLRIVLTAHPTQFYPGPVLGIITDLANAIKKEHLLEIKQLLLQLGKTPFFKRQRPTPYEEAGRLAWYLEHVFYPAVPKIYQRVAVWSSAHNKPFGNYDFITVGFWPGGDRDGNPFVTCNTTLKVSEKLRTTLLHCYYKDVRRLKRRLTFRGISKLIQALEQRLYAQIYDQKSSDPLTAYDLEATLVDIISRLETEHNGLFLDEVEHLLASVRLFGLHFASIDIRQDSRVLNDALQLLVYSNKKQVSQWQDWFNVSLNSDGLVPEDEVLADTLNICAVVRKMQAHNGERGCHRFIISNCGNAESIGHVYALAKASGMTVPIPLDIVPLFETINDLIVAADVMEELYGFETYREHLSQRNDRQVIMLGFSDGTKDGGYVAANWNIFLAKERITQVSRRYGITAVFFDGRGGPPARGGGNTHKFYAAQGQTIEQKEIQLTVQGQTVSSKFGNTGMAGYNIEQLLTAGLGRHDNKKTEVTIEQRELLQQIADLSLASYSSLKQDPVFIRYLEQVSPLRYFARTNIASRPGKRGREGQLTLEDLRAISFVGAWSLLKQNVPGYYGIGFALETLIDQGLTDDLIALYKESEWFRTLVRNSMQSLAKCYFPLTQYISEDPEFGVFWNQIHDEYQRSKSAIEKIAGLDALLADEPANRASIALREEVVLPLLTIQQFGLMQLKSDPDDEMRPIYEKMVVRAMYGIINAARNSA